MAEEQTADGSVYVELRPMAEQRSETVEDSDDADQTVQADDAALITGLSDRRHTLLTVQMDLLADTESQAKIKLLEKYILDLEEKLAINLVKSLFISDIECLQAYRFRPNRDDVGNEGDVTLLQLAAAYCFSVELLSLMAAKCPALLTTARKAPYEGQTVLHTLVSRDNVQAVKAILDQQSPEERRKLLTMSTNTDAKSAINFTVMLGGLPLSVAALTFNLEMVGALVERGAQLTDVNDRGDTVFHSLICFSALYPDKQPRVLEVMNGLHQILKDKLEPRCLWLRENAAGLTALKLAARCSQPLLFDFILSLKGVYCELDDQDWLCDSLLYDITDIDPVAIYRLDKVYRLTAARFKASQKENKDAAPAPAPSMSHKVFSSSHKTSVLQIINEKPAEEAFKILTNKAVRYVISDKWLKYRWLMIIWTVLHITFMTWITVYAIYKARKISRRRSVENNSTAADLTTPVPEIPAVNFKHFVIATAILTSLWSVLLLLYELMRLVKGRNARDYLVSLLFHSNGFYRLQLLVLAVSLLVDAGFLANWYWREGEPTNVPLIVGLLFGWWFTSFFLRPWKKFSFFTVMLQEVLIGDMLRFSTIFIPQIIAFSVALHITYMPNENSQQDQFQSVGRAMMTLFKLMTGLADVAVLYDAPSPWLAVTLFVMYVLLTSLLMLNALIALMSNTCSIVSQNREAQWRLQRLSVVLFLQESLWMVRAGLRDSGEVREIKIHDSVENRTFSSARYFVKISTARGGPGGGLGLTPRPPDGAKRGGGPKAAVGGGAGSAPSPSSDMCDLLVSYNYQRTERDVTEATVKEGNDVELPATPIPERGVAGTNDLLVSSAPGAPPAAAAAEPSSTYIRIRTNLQRLSDRAAGTPSAKPGADKTPKREKGKVDGARPGGVHHQAAVYKPKQLATAAYEHLRAGVQRTAEAVRKARTAHAAKQDIPSPAKSSGSSPHDTATDDRLQASEGRLGVASEEALNSEVRDVVRTDARKKQRHDRRQKSL